MKSDTELRELLAKMLPETVAIFKSIASIQGDRDKFLWLDTDGDRLVFSNRKVLDTELPYLAWLVEKTIKGNPGTDVSEWARYVDILKCVVLNDDRTDILGWVNATWQQRVTALAKVKGIV